MRLKSLALIAALFLIASKINAQTIFSDTFESSTGWTLTGDWQIDSTWAGGGSPGGTTNFPDPAFDHTAGTGNKVLGEIVGGDYDLSQPIPSTTNATSPVINASASSGAKILTYYRWLNSDYPNFITQTLEVTDLQGNWVIIWQNACPYIAGEPQSWGQSVDCSTGSASWESFDNSWVYQEFDVTQYVNGNTNFQIRFSKTHGSNGAWNRSGWNVDDLYVGSPPNYKLSLTPPNQSGAAALGNYATYNLNVQNQGALNDSYNIALAGNTWISQALLNGSPITNTGNINSGTSLSLQIQVNIPSGASNGQMDNLAVTLTSVGDQTVYETANISTVAIGNCTIPMNENFDAGILNPGNFPQVTDNSLDPNGLVNDLASNEPSGMYALHLNAYPQLGDTVTSCIFDLSGQTAIDFYYSYEKGAGQSSPGQGEFLIVEYLNSTQNWVQLNSHEGDWNTQFDFVPVELQLPQDAFHSNFRFRIFNTSQSGGWPGSSNWAVDNIFLGLPPNYKLSLTPPNQNGAAALGNYATYNLNVQNQGLLNDSYNIALTGNTWVSQALLNGSPITNTGNINSGTSLSLQIQVSIPSGASNGQIDNLAVTLTSVGDQTVYKTANIITIGIGNCTIPMNENFDAGILNPGNFPQATDNSLDPNGLVNDLASNEPSGMYALHLNAYPQLGDTVTSCIFDLSGQTAIDFYYSYEKGAGQSSPGQGEFLIVEYLNSTQNWVQLNSHEGDWNTQFDFVPVELQLPQDAFHSNFRFRIFNTSPWGGWPGSSNWAVDNIFLGLPPNYKLNLSPKIIAGSGTIGSVINYTITVNNQGVLNDNYNISFTGNTWVTQTLVNGIPATNTGNINSGTSATFNIEVTIPQTATSGQSDNLVVTVTSVNDATVSKTVSGSTTAIGTSPLPLADNFDTGILNVNNWPQSTDNSLDPDGIINSYAPNPPSGIYSLHLNSYPQLGDTVTSSIVNLSGQSVITLNYYFLVGGGSGTPGPGNFLKAEYLNSSQNWVPLNIHDGTWIWPPPTDFTEVNSLLPQDALHANFRVRFLSIGQWSCQGCNSWAVDDIFLGIPPPYKFSFTPAFANGNGYPGDTVTYPYVIKNKGLNADSYNLTVSGNTYPTTFWANGNPITVTGTIIPGDSLVLSVEVAIPQTATLGFVDAANITVTSVGDPTISKNSAINTLTGDTMPPEAPSSLIGTLNGTQVDLVWQNPLYNIDGTPLTDLAKIKVYRQDNASPFPFFTLIDSVAAPNQNYSDLAPFVNTSYYLTAVDFSGNESWQSNVTNVFNIAGLGTVVWQDTLETTANWVFANSDPTVIWNVDATPSNALGTSVPYAGTACLNYNNGTNFDTYGSANNGTATLNQNLNLSGLADPTLFFWSLSDTEWGNYYDQKWVEISNDNFVTTIATYQVVPQQQGVWEPVTVTLDTAWQSVQLRFRFDTIDGAGNSGAGWFIDNLGLYSSVDILGPGFSGLGIPKVIDNFSTYEKVKVTVTDPSGVDFVQLNYRIGETGNFTSVTMNLSQVVNVYLDSIPPPANVTKTKVYCYFMARDLSDSSNISYFPKNYLADPLNNLFSYEVRLVPPGTLDDEPDYGEINLSWGQPGENGIELKYDDGSSEFQSILPNSPPGLNNPSVATFASRFDIATQTQINGNAQLNSIKIFIPNGAVPNAGYKLRVFEDNQGQPGNLIWESPDQQQTAPFGQFVNFELVDPLTNLGLPVGSGIFYVGVEQTSSTLISLGGDTSFNPPYVFNSNTHFLQGQGTGWAAIESLAPIYGQIIPMIRCFVEPVPIAPAPQLGVNKQKTVGKQEFRFKKGNSTSGKGSVNVTLTYPIVAYKLYKKNGASQNALEVVTTGSVIYTGTNQTYTDLQVAYPNQYSYAVTVVYNVNGTNVESEPGNLVVSTPLFSDANEPQNLVPTVFSIEQNYPNPFNPVTNIKFGIPEKTFTRLVVYNILGQLVKTIVSKELTPSYYTFRWDGTDNNGNQVASGVYFAKIEAGKFVKTKKMTFLK